jgi:hypothetical protein
MSIPSQLYFPGMVAPFSKLVVLKVKAIDVAVLLDDIMDATELLLEDETARLDDDLEDELENEFTALLEEELGTCAAALELFALRSKMFITVLAMNKKPMKICNGFLKKRVLVSKKLRA